MDMEKNEILNRLKDGSGFEYIDRVLQNDEAFMSEAVKINGTDYQN